MNGRFLDFIFHTWYYIFCELIHLFLVLGVISFGLSSSKIYITALILHANELTRRFPIKKLILLKRTIANKQAGWLYYPRSLHKLIPDNLIGPPRCISGQNRALSKGVFRFGWLAEDVSLVPLSSLLWLPHRLKILPNIVQHLTGFLSRITAGIKVTYNTLLANSL